MALQLHCYTDESGNTGNNIFDDNQPIFWTGTLISPDDLDASASSLVKSLTRRMGVDELHGNELRLKGIEKIAPKIKKFLRKNNCKIVLTKIEKRHLVCTKLADQIFDNGNNKGVSAIHYSIRFFRMHHAAMLDELLTDYGAQRFWEIFTKHDVDGFRELLRELQKEFLHNEAIPKRNREIFLDALEYGIDHTDEILDRHSLWDAPNAVAFSSVLDGIREIYDGNDFKIVVFKHDEQTQFIKVLSQLYEFQTRVRTRPDSLMLFPKFGWCKVVCVNSHFFDLLEEGKILSDFSDGC